MEDTVLYVDTADQDYTITSTLNEIRRAVEAMVGGQDLVVDGKDPDRGLFVPREEITALRFYPADED